MRQDEGGIAGGTFAEDFFGMVCEFILLSQVLVPIQTYEGCGIGEGYKFVEEIFDLQKSVCIPCIRRKHTNTQDRVSQ